MAVPRCAWGRSRRTPVPTPHSEGQPPRLATPAVGPLRHLGSSTGWYGRMRTDAGSDLSNSLDYCLLTSTLARVDPRNWKWCVIAAGSAAQTAMVMVLEAQGDWK